MLNSHFVTSRKEIVRDYRQLKSRLEAAEGGRDDLNPSPDHVLLQDTKNVADNLTYTTSDMGFLKVGQYMSTTTGEIGENRILKTLQSYRETEDGLVESVRSADLDGDGKSEFIETVRFDPANPNETFIILN